MENKDILNESIFIKELNIPYHVMDLFDPLNWCSMLCEKREFAIQTLVNYIGNELNLSNEYQIVFEEQDTISEATFDESRNPPCIVIPPDYLIYGFKVIEFIRDNDKLFVPLGSRISYEEQNRRTNDFINKIEPNKGEFARKILYNKAIGLTPVGRLFQICIHEMEHARQYEIEKIPENNCPYKKDTLEYKDFMMIHYNSTHNVYKIPNPKIPFLKINAAGYLTAVNIHENLDGNLHNLLHKLQYVERLAYIFAEKNMKKNFIPYFASKGYDTKLLSDYMKQVFNHESIINELEKCYGRFDIQAEFDKIMGDLENVKITPDNKKLYKYVVTQLCKAAKAEMRKKKVCL